MLKAPRKDALPGPYTTKLKTGDELAFRLWVDANKVPFNPSDLTDKPEYDMRGFWKKYVANPKMNEESDPTATGVEGGVHYTDEFKTPYHPTFSVNSKWATNKAPKWQGSDDTGYRLVDDSGNVIHDETKMAGPNYVALPNYFMDKAL